MEDVLKIDGYGDKRGAKLDLDDFLAYVHGFPSLPRSLCLTWRCLCLPADYSSASTPTRSISRRRRHSRLYVVHILCIQSKREREDALIFCPIDISQFRFFSIGVVSSCLPQLPWVVEPLPSPAPSIIAWGFRVVFWDSGLFLQASLPFRSVWRLHEMQPMRLLGAIGKESVPPTQPWPLRCTAFSF